LKETVGRLAAGGDREPAMRRRARATYEALYRPEANLKTLLAIYEQARAQAVVNNRRVAAGEASQR
jgi:hypothetical protein